MALSAANVRVGVTGQVLTGLTSATAPTNTGSATTGFTDLGYVSEDGVTVTLPDAGDTTQIQAWQGAATVRTIIGTPTDNSQISFTLIETKLDTLQLYYGVTAAAQTATDGKFVVNNSVARPYGSFIVDVIDGANLKRIYIPYGTVTSVEDMTFANQEAIGYGVTIDCQYSATAGGNLIVWETAAHS